MADIADLNFKKLAEKPLEFVLTHPIDGSELEHDGKPFAFQIYAMDSKVYRDADIAEVRKQSKDDLNADIADRVINIQDANRRKIAACIVSGSVYSDGKWLKITKDNALPFLEEFDWIAEQCLAKLRDREELLKDAKKK